MKAIIGGLVTGFGAYYLIKWIRSKGTTVVPQGGWKGAPFPISGLGDEVGVYGNLLDIRKQLRDATSSYLSAAKRIDDLDMRLLGANDEYANADASNRTTIMLRIAEIQRQRDFAVMEAELLIRNIVNPLREKLVAEEARLKSAVVAPGIAVNRTGNIPAF